MSSESGYPDEKLIKERERGAVAKHCFEHAQIVQPKTIFLPIRKFQLLLTTFYDYDYDSLLLCNSLCKATTALPAGLRYRSTTDVLY